MMETDFSERCTVKNKSQQSQASTREVWLNIMKKFSLWGWFSFGSGCPKKQKNLHPWRFSELNWTQPRATLLWLWSETCFVQEVRPDDLQSALN